MDTMKILLGATIALLFAAVVLSWNNMKQGIRDTPADEIARLSKQVDELRAQQEQLDTERKLQELRASNSAPSSAPAAYEPSSEEIEAMKAELAQKDAELAKIQEEKDKAERKADVYRDEAGIVGQKVLESSDDELRRARMIRNALLIGNIREFVEDPEIGSFVTVDVKRPENVQVGTILAIRRNTGILGQIKISDVNGGEAVANLMPGFGQIRPEIGDELITPLQY